MNNSRQHLQESVDAVVDRAIAGKRIIGAVVIVSRSGERIYQQVAGWADCETRRPMARDTIFRYASLAKPLVTVAALRLVEQQRLTLDGEMTEFWKGMRFWPITQISRGAWHTCFMRFHGG